MESFLSARPHLRALVHPSGPLSAASLAGAEGELRRDMLALRQAFRADDPPFQAVLKARREATAALRTTEGEPVTNAFAHLAEALCDALTTAAPLSLARVANPFNA